VKLEVQSIEEVNLVLRVGEITQEVAISATAATIQTTESHVGTLIETKMVNELPLNGRNFLQLQLLSPGVVTGKSSTCNSSDPRKKSWTIKVDCGKLILGAADQ